MDRVIIDTACELAQLYADGQDDTPLVLTFTRPKINNIPASAEVVVTVSIRHKTYVPRHPLEAAVPV